MQIMVHFDAEVVCICHELFTFIQMALAILL